MSNLMHMRVGAQSLTPLCGSRAAALVTLDTKAINCPVCRHRWLSNQGPWVEDYLRALSAPPALNKELIDREMKDTIVSLRLLIASLEAEKGELIERNAQLLLMVPDKPEDRAATQRAVRFEMLLEDIRDRIISELYQ